MISTTFITPHLQNGQLVSYPEDPSTELAKVEAEVEKVTDVIGNLVYPLKGQINSRFLRVLPTEIIVEIFAYCGVVEPGDDKPSKVDNSLPLKLGAVCTAFRTIAWSTPSLWATVILNIEVSSRIPAQAKLLNDWLSRSGRLPLSIYLCSSLNLLWAIGRPELILKVVNEFADRWRRVDIRLPSSCYRDLLFPKQRFPMLQSLTLKPQGGQSDRSHQINICDASQLSHVSLHCLYLRSIKLSWNILTTLELEAFYIDECLEMMRQSTNLTSLSIGRILSGDDNHSISTDRAIMPSLASLTIVNNRATELGMMFDKIMTPSLREFSFTADSTTRAPYTHILDLVKRSACPLESVSFKYCSFPELKQFLSMVPSLKHLDITSSVRSPQPTLAPFTDDILQLCDPTFAFANKKPCLLPNLEVLRYRGPQTFSWPRLRQMVQSRLAGHPLLAGELAFDRQLGQTESAGMSVVLPTKLKELTLILFTEEEMSSAPPLKALHFGKGLQVRLETISKQS